jgi:hypothetical protein
MDLNLCSLSDEDAAHCPYRSGSGECLQVAGPMKADRFGLGHPLQRDGFRRWKPLSDTAPGTVTNAFSLLGAISKQGLLRP